MMDISTEVYLILKHFEESKCVDLREFSVFSFWLCKFELFVENMAEYDLLLIGFPIWYGGAPNVVNTFVKGYDL